jgi:hypothetical protein
MAVLLHLDESFSLPQLCQPLVERLKTALKASLANILLVIYDFLPL